MRWIIILLLSITAARADGIAWNPVLNAQSYRVHHWAMAEGRVSVTPAVTDVQGALSMRIAAPGLYRIEACNASGCSLTSTGLFYDPLAVTRAAGLESLEGAYCTPVYWRPVVVRRYLCDALRAIP